MTEASSEIYSARNKTDLIIEVWEKLDCESVGAREIVAIERAVEDVFGRSAVDSPMLVARLLADEGAELRHSEIMKLYVERNAVTVYDAVFRTVLKLSDLRTARNTMRELENVRAKFTADEDKEGLRLLRDFVKRAKAELLREAKKDPANSEIAEWLTIWLQSPEIFDQWITLRLNSPEFVQRFGLQDRK